MIKGPEGAHIFFFPVLSPHITPLYVVGWGQHSGTLVMDFAVLVLVLWVGLETSKSLNLDVKITFAGSHTGDGLRDVRFPWASH